MKVKNFLKNIDPIKDIYFTSGLMNKEHVIPKSFRRKIGIKKDNLHFVFNANASINHQRGNLKFCEFDSKLDVIKIKDIGFQPPRYSRGIIARSCIYFIWKYKLSENIYDDIISKDTILKWNFEYSPTFEEKYRNKLVWLFYKERNHFIDHKSNVQDFLVKR